MDGKNMRLLAVLAVAFVAFAGFAVIADSSDYDADGTNEAKIGDKEYATLAEAITEATSGQTVVLMKDVSSSTQFEIAKSITLDGNGKKITSTVSSNAAILIVSSNVTVKNLTVIGPNTTPSGWDGGEYGIKVYGSISNVVLDNITVSGANAGILVNGFVTIQNTITVSGNEYGGIEISKGSQSEAVGKLTFNTGASVVCTDALVPAMWIDGFESKYSKTVANAVVNVPGSMKNVIIYTSEKDQCYIVTDSYSLSGCEASVNGVYYQKFTVAAQRVTTGQTIEILKKCDHSTSYGSLTAAENVKINGNGKALTINAKSVYIKNGTSFDNVTFVAAGAGDMFVLTSSENVTFSKCTFSGDSTTDSMCFIKSSSYSGKLTVDGCIFINSGEKVNRDIDVAIASSTSNTKIIVKDCVMTSGSGTDSSTPVRISGQNLSGLYEMTGNEMGGVELVTAYKESAIVLIAETSCKAKIGDLFYITVSEAIQKATSNQTVSIVDDCSISSSMTVSNNIKLDVYEGKTLTLDGSMSDIVLTISNGSSLSGTVAYKTSSSVSSAEFYNVTAGTNGTTSGFTVSKGSLKITGIIDVTKEASIEAEGALILKNVEVTQTGMEGGLTLKKTDSGSISIEGMIITSTATMTLSSNATVQTNTTLVVNGKVCIDSIATITNNGAISGTGTLENAGTINGNTPTVSVITLYTITISDNGNGTAEADKKTAKSGETVTLTATPKEGFLFKKWETNDGITVGSDGKFTMPSKNVTLKAVFEKKYTVTVKVSGGGTGTTATASPSTAFKGDTVTLTYTAPYGTKFFSWYSADVTIGSDGKFAMPEKDVTVTGTFGTYSDTVKSVANGSITIPWELAQKDGIADSSKIILTIDKPTSPKQSNIPKDATAYEISMTYDGQTVSKFSDNIEVKLNYTLPSGAKGADYYVYYVSEDGKTVENMNGTYSNNGFVFKTVHLSTFVVSSTVIEPAKDFDWTMILVIVAIAIVIIVVIAIIYMRNNGIGPFGPGSASYGDGFYSTQGYHLDDRMQTNGSSGGFDVKDDEDPFKRY